MAISLSPTNIRKFIQKSTLISSLLVLTSGITVPAVVAADNGITAENARGLQWYLKDDSVMHLPKAWAITKGKGVVIGLVDQGVESDHPDLVGNILAGHDYSPEQKADNGLKPVIVSEAHEMDGTLTSITQTHGTEMASLAVGHGHGTDNSLGVMGTAPEAKILSVAFADSLNGTWTGKTSDSKQIADGIRYAVDHGAKVLNLSFGGNPDNDLKGAIAYAEQHDVVVVAGAGNAQEGLIGFPAGYYGVIAVSGVDQDLSMDPDSSSSGPTFLDSSEGIAGTAVTAPFGTEPNVGIPVAIPQAASFNQQSVYDEANGTSGATAIVSGIAALVRAKYPTMSAANVVNRIIKTAYHPAGTGYSPKHGFGVVDAYAALTANVPTVCENPLGSVASNNPGVWLEISDSSKYHYSPKCTVAAATASKKPVGAAGSAKFVAPVAAGLVLLLLGALVFWFLRRRKTGGAHTAVALPEASQSPTSPDQPQTPGPTAHD